MYPDDLRYSEDHEWVRLEGDVATIGITHHAQEALGEIVFVGDLAESGDEVEKGDSVGSIESVKAVSDVFSPLTGEIVEGNENLDDSPELINSDPYGDGWILKVKLSDKSELEELMDSAAYQEFLKEND